MKKIILFFYLFTLQNCYSKNSSEVSVLENYFNNIIALEFDKAKNLTEKIKHSKTKEIALLLVKIIEDNGQNKLSILDKNFTYVKHTQKKDIEQQILTSFLIAFKNLNYQPKNRVKSFQYFNNAYNLSLKTGNSTFQKMSLLFFNKFYLKGGIQSNKDFRYYLNKYKKECQSPIDWLYYYSFKFNLLGQTEVYHDKISKINLSRKNIIESLDSLVKRSESKVFGKTLFYYYKDKANYFIREHPKKARKFYLKSEALLGESAFFNFQKFYFHINLSRISNLLDKPNAGLNHLNNAKKYISYNDSLLDLLDISTHKATLFNKLKKYDSAFYHQHNTKSLLLKIKLQDQNQKVSELKTELETEKKEKENIQLKKENLEIESKRKKNRNFLIAAILCLLSGSIIAFLLLKNSKKKQKLAEQQKELETQKNLTLLKEQEITTINAMVDGQEKERKRIAEDLHDNLGSVLATLKLHFENLKINATKRKINQKELFDKTENLIDEAYLKVRRIAHVKNAGVIASQGLLMAVKMMAEKISSADKIKIEVISFGLEERLENNLEITLFRIIQELTTNIIKHAKAKNATLNITLYDKNLNIIIEDDGKGFDAKKINLKNGMGINSIITRVKHLKGTFTIDSTPKRGSSILINIPIENT